MSKIFGVIFILIISLIQFSYAENNIAFIDIDKIINESELGKKIYKNVEDNFKKENKKLIEIEKNLITKEQEVLKQKNILSKDELNKKITNLKKEINDFQKKKKLLNEKFNKIKVEKKNEMVQSLNEILSKYAENNDISLVIQKKFIVIAKTGLDITSDILKIFNKENK